MDTYAYSRRSVDGHPVGRLHGEAVQDGECVEPQASQLGFDLTPSLRPLLLQQIPPQSFDLAKV